MRPCSTTTAAGRIPLGVITRLETKTCVIYFGYSCSPAESAGEMNMQGENDFLRLAIQLATENVRSGVGGPFGPVGVKNGEVLATGVNRVTVDNDPTAHAEVNAIREACKAQGHFQLSGCVL